MGYVTASLHTGTLRGKVSRGITVHTNDSTQPKLRLVIRAEIITAVILAPHESMTFTNADPRHNRTRLLARRAPTESGELQISDLNVSASWLSAEATRIEEERPAGEGLPAARPGDWLLEIHVTGPLQYERRREELKFKTGLERQPEMTIPVVLALRPPVNLSVEKLELLPPAEGKPSSATLLVSVRRGLSVSDLQVVAEPEVLSVRLEPTGGRFYKAHVSWKDGELTEGAVVFRIGEEQLRVPVTPAAIPAATQ